MKKLIAVALSVSALGVLAIVALSLRESHMKPASVDASPAPQKTLVNATSGGNVRRSGDGFAGYGWSTQADAQQAAEEAVMRATAGTSGNPDIALVCYSPQYSAQQIQDKLLGGSRPVRHVFGMSTHEGILCADGYHTSKTGVLGILTMRLAGLEAGVGGADFEGGTPTEAAKLAYRRAVEDAGVSGTGKKPSLILLSVIYPNEEQVLAALAEEAGPGVTLIGGTAAGSVDEISRKKMSNWSMIANRKLVKNGLVVAVFYSNQGVASSYGGGYRRSSISGTITKCQSRLILEIDGRPAYDVYNEWLGGKVAEAAKRGENVVNFCSLYPVCKTLGTHNQFIRVWPSEDPKAPGSLRTGSGIREGDKVYLSEGNWNILLNHFATIPQKARESRSDMQAIAGLFIYCGGAVECIPRDQRPQMATLVGQSMNDIPWMGVFSWGEQGSVSGVGNVHSNLSSCTVLFPAPAAAH